MACVPNLINFPFSSLTNVYFVSGSNENPSALMDIPDVNKSEKKIYAFVLPPETCKRWAKKTVETKAILTRGGTGGKFMNKLIRIERVSERH